MPEEFIFRIYQRLLLRFMGQGQPIYGWLTLIFGVIVWAACYYQATVDIEILYRVFGSVMQALLTLIAVLGTVSIFRLNRLDSSEAFKKDFIPNYMQKFVVYTFFVAFLSLLCLIFTPYISALYLGWPVLYIICILTARALFLVAKSVPDLLFDSRG